MKICLAAPSGLPPQQLGGIGTYVAELAGAYSQRGHCVDVVGFEIRQEAMTEHQWGRLISLQDHYSNRPGGSPSERMTRPFRSFPYLWRIANWGELSHAKRAARAFRHFLLQPGNDYDVVEFSNWQGHGAFVPRSSASIVVRLSTPAADCGDRYFTSLERRTCRRADLILAHSNAVKHKGAMCYGYDPSSAVLVQLGVADVDFHSVARRQDGLDVLVVGRAEHRKGTDILLDALAEVMDDIPELRVVFLGANLDAYLSRTPNAATAWTRLRKYQSERIIDLGRVAETEKNEWYARSHWTLIPSRYESFGLVAAESIRAGTPVVASDVGGLSEAVKEMPGSRLVKSVDTAGWIEALREIGRLGPSFAESQRRQSRAAYETRFTAERMAEESLAHYKRLRAKKTSLTKA